MEPSPFSLNGRFKCPNLIPKESNNLAVLNPKVNLNPIRECLKGIGVFNPQIPSNPV